MERRKLGRPGLEVTVACLGTMTWGSQNSEDEAHAQMDRALEAGINFFDTAEIYAVPPSPETYGKTEAMIGSWFKARPGAREKIILASKVAGRGMRYIRKGAYIDRENILAAVDESLRRLQTDRIDLYQLHWPNRGFYHFGGLWKFSPRGNDYQKQEENLHEVLQTLGELIESGKIRHIGLSNESAWGTMQYLRLAEKFQLPRIASIQNEYSLMYRLYEPDLAEVGMYEDVSLLAYSPLATGMLTGKYRNGARPKGSRWGLDSRANQRDTKQAHAAVDQYLAIAKKYDWDPGHLALAFAASRPFMTSVIIGATSMEQLDSNIAAFGRELTSEMLTDIAGVRRNYPVPY